MPLFLHIFALLACTPSPAPAPPAPELPQISKLEIQIPETAKVGEKIIAQATYTLSEGCWTTHTVLSQDGAMAMVDTTTHTPRGDDCLTGETSTITQIPLTESGVFHWTVVIDGVTVAERSVQVAPAA
jgi:hypothetical protein